MMAKHQLGVDLTDDEASDIEHRLWIADRRSAARVHREARATGRKVALRTVELGLARCGSGTLRLRAPAC
jgi:hypothetical protein